MAGAYYEKIARINLTTGELVKLKKKGRHAFRCMMSF